MLSRSAALLGLLVFVAGCDGVPCRSPDDCPFGSYCVLDVDGARVSGACVQDCLEHTDCPAPPSLASRAICDNRGRCQTVARIPRLRLRAPEAQARFPEGTRSVRVSGEVETAAEQVRLRVRAGGGDGCPGAPAIRVSLDNRTGDFATLPFTVDPVPVEPSSRFVEVEATVGSARQRRRLPIEVACPGCAELRIDAPGLDAAPSGLVLDSGLRGQVRPPVPVALWRVRSAQGALFDGRLLPDPSGRFLLDRLPLFGGTSQIEVSVSGVGAGRGETRCSTFVRASASDRGLRVVMTWDTRDSDLDLHLVGPGGALFDPMSALSPRTPDPSFGGDVLDDFDGLGPEVLSATGLPDGVYGLVVEPLLGAGTATLRLLVDGAPLTVGPVGPVFLDADRAELWVAGTLRVDSGAASFEALGDRLPLATPPTRGPEDWPMYQ